MARRDNFTSAVKQRLASQVGWLCSHPECRRLTVAGTASGNALTSIGVAAHITAAAPGGPRFDPAQDAGERRAIDNGIWLCSAHAKIIDDDPQTYTVKLLQGWKTAARHRAFLAMSNPDASSPGPPRTYDASTVFEAFHAAAVVDLQGFMRGPRWPAHPVSLSLRVTSKTPEPVRFTVDTLAAAARVHDRLVVVAPPGTGKSTTLIQLSDAINGQADQVAFYLPLREWALDRSDFLDAPLGRDAYRGLSSDDVRSLARAGRLRLVLDGWNELDDAARSIATTEVEQLGRDYPLLGVVISTRRQALDLPFEGEQLTLELLEEAQQRELARALAGDRGEAALEYGRRTAGLSDLVALPLYLTSLVQAMPDEQVYPETKDGVLAMMVAANARAARDQLRVGLDNRQDSILAALAHTMTRSHQTAITDDQARPALAREAVRMGGPLPLQPTAILDLLVNRHALVRSPSGALEFQHQQFQEWYASAEIERLMIEAVDGPSEARDVLRSTLDDRVWEEAALFACERLSRRDAEGDRIVAAVIDECLGLDPVLAAAMIHRSAPAVWDRLGERVQTFARSWAAATQTDRPHRFMLTTGRPEFSDVIRPLLASQAGGGHLHILRLPDRFDPEVLGPDAGAFLSGLAPGHRGEILGEIVDRGGAAGMDFAVSQAIADGHDEVVTDVAMALLHRQAERALSRLLPSASTEVRRTLARRWTPESLADPALCGILSAAREETDFLVCEIERLRRVLYREPVPPAELTSLLTLIARDDYPAEAPVAEWLIGRAFDLDPSEAAAAMAKRLERGQVTPRRLFDRLRETTIFRDDGPVAERLLAAGADVGALRAEACFAGPKVIAILFDRLLGMGSAPPHSESTARARHFEQRDRLVGLLALSPWSRLETAVLALPEDLEPARLEDVIDVVRHGRRPVNAPDPGDAPVARPTVSEAFGDRLKRWTGAVLVQGDEAAEVRADLASILGHSGRALIREAEQLFLAEAHRIERLDAAFRAGTFSRIPDGLRMSHDAQFREPLLGLGDGQTVDLLTPWLAAPRLALTAALVMAGVENRLLSRRELATTKGFSRRPLPRPWLRLSPTEPTANSEVYDRVVAAVRGRLGQTADRSAQGQAAALARIAFSLPHHRDGELVAALLDLPLRAADRQSLLATLALIGEVLPASRIHEGIALFHAEVGSHLNDLRQNQYQLDDWLALFLASDSPRNVLGALAALQDFQRRPHELDGLLAAIGASPSSDADTLLLELAQTDGAFVDDHGWRTAVLKRDADVAANLILDLIERGILKDWVMSGGLRETGPLGERLRRSSKGPGRIWDVYRATRNPLLRRALVHSGRPEIVLALIRDDAARSQTFQQDLEDAVYDVAIAHKPHENSNVYELVPVAAPKFRADLFGMTLEGTVQGRLAAAALEHLDDLRDSYGAPQSEPRHPNLSTDRPWPSAAAAAGAAAFKA